MSQQNRAKRIQKRKRYQARLALVAWLTQHGNPHDEDGNYSEAKALRLAQSWWTLSDEQLVKAHNYMLDRHSPYRSMTPRSPKMVYPVKATRVLG